MSDAGRGHTSLSTRRKSRALGQASVSPGLRLGQASVCPGLPAGLSPGSKETGQP